MHVRILFAVDLIIPAQLSDFLILQAGRIGVDVEQCCSDRRLLLGILTGSGTSTVAISLVLSKLCQ